MKQIPKWHATCARSGCGAEAADARGRDDADLAEGGRYLIVGFAAGDIPKVPANLLLLRNAQLVSELASSLRRANLE